MTKTTTTLLEGEKNWILDPRPVPRWVEIPCAKPPEKLPDRRCRFSLKPNGGPQSWDWKMETNGPTLTPSIDCKGGCGWHGHIIDGKRQ